MSTRSKIILDEIFLQELKEYESNTVIEKKLDEGNIEAFLSAMNKGMIIEILKRLCKDRYTGELPTDLIMGAYYANILAHNGNPSYYLLKSKLLEYVFINNIWGNEPFNSFGIGEDEYGNEVAYFDVPQCGQVSFHLVSTNYDENDVPRYNLEWCREVNEDFPTYRLINNFHNFILALGYNGYDILGDETLALKPINFFAIQEDEKNICYFIGVDYFYDTLDEYYEDEGKTDFENLIRTISIKKIFFSKREGIISEEYITNKEKKIELLKQNSAFNKTVSDILSKLGITMTDEKELE